MQLDALTAGTVLTLVQFCVALIMTGIFSAAPKEACTRYWASSGVVLATGLLMVVFNGGAPRPLILLVGNNALMLGLVLQWAGIRAFYRKARGYAGWIVGMLFFVLFGLLLLRQAPVTQRALLSSIGILSMLLLYFHEIWTGQGKRRSFAGILALAAVTLLIAAYVVRTWASLTRQAEILPLTNSLLAVTLLYLVPIAGGMLLSAALILLYFERLVADKHHLATHDDLTGVLNRRAVVLAGEREVAVATRLRQPVAVAFVDVDHFKQINDKLGHDAGDRVIVQVAQLLRQTCRSIDLVGRYGGDEFCIIFPGADCGSAAAVGERLIAAIRQHSPELGLEVSVSIGLAALTEQDDNRSWASLIHRADEQLYKAKSAGRNRLSVG